MRTALVFTGLTYALGYGFLLIPGLYE